MIFYGNICITRHTIQDQPICSNLEEIAYHLKMLIFYHKTSIREQCSYFFLNLALLPVARWPSLFHSNTCFWHLSVFTPNRICLLRFAVESWDKNEIVKQSMLPFMYINVVFIISHILMAFTLFRIVEIQIFCQFWYREGVVIMWYLCVWWRNKKLGIISR